MDGFEWRGGCIRKEDEGSSSDYVQVVHCVGVMCCRWRWAERESEERGKRCNVRLLLYESMRRRCDEKRSRLSHQPICAGLLTFYPPARPWNTPEGSVVYSIAVLCAEDIQWSDKRRTREEDSLDCTIVERALEDGGVTMRSE